MSTVLTALSTAKDTLVLAAEINPPGSVQPPGTEGLLTVLGWLAWVVTLAAIGGVFLVAGKMAVSHRRGEGSEAVGQLGWVLGAAVLIGAAGPVVNALI